MKSSLLLVAAALVPLLGQPRPAIDPQVVAARNTTEEKLQAIAIVERKVMVAMSDGKRMATDVYRPKDTTKKYPTIFVRTPYNFNYWDVRTGATRDMTAELEAVKNRQIQLLVGELLADFIGITAHLQLTT